MKKKLISSKDPRLRKVSKKVRKIGKKVKDLVRDMADTLAAQTDPKGVAIAAPQIGVNLRVFYVNYKGFKGAFINPVITKKKRVTTKKTADPILEGCLSIPHHYGPIERANKVTLEYLDLSGKKQKKTFTDFNAQIVQHEVDHLNGTLFIDHVLKQKKTLYKHLGGEEWEKVEI